MENLGSHAFISTASTTLGRFSSTWISCFKTPWNPSPQTSNSRRTSNGALLMVIQTLGQDPPCRTRHHHHYHHQV
ncbi:hypothetical protein BS47DRAFT_1351867, partial [Hydnum rufescens UP504]